MLLLIVDSGGPSLLSSGDLDAECLQCLWCGYNKQRRGGAVVPSSGVEWSASQSVARMHQCYL